LKEIDGRVRATARAMATLPERLNESSRIKRRIKQAVLDPVRHNNEIEVVNYKIKTLTIVRLEAITCHKYRHVATAQSSTNLAPTIVITGRDG
jgi:hypothetical protein